MKSDPHNYILSNGVVSKNSHAASYAMVSYTTAYLKTHYPIEYMAALLTSVNDKKKLSPYLTECRRMNITVLPPSINYSDSHFRVMDDTTILFGLLSIDGIGPSVVDSVMNGRSTPYTTIYDFLRRVNPDIINRSTLEHLLRAGALDELVPPQKERLLSRQEKLDVLQKEKDELGLYVSDHPLYSAEHILRQHTSLAIDQLDRSVKGSLVTVAGLLAQIDRVTTKKGATMYKLLVEDLTAQIEILVFPRDVEKVAYKFIEGDIVVLEGRVNKEGDDEFPITRLNMLNIERVHIPEHETGQPITLEFEQCPTEHIIDKLSWMIDQFPGDCPVYLVFPTTKHNITLKMKKPTSRNALEKLEMISLGERIGWV